MNHKSKIIAGQSFKSWKTIRMLGTGGNGEVWLCENNGVKAAMKLLKSVNEKPYTRFKDETNVLSSNSDVDGIMPIMDKHLPLPTQIKHDTPFYVMPVAELSIDILRGKEIDYKIDAILEVATTLEILHSRGIAHRDIKFNNILYHDNKFKLSDFGLVDYPSKKDVSSTNEPIGPKWTIAPEMKRTSSTADGKKADVYSLAKTLWIVLSEDQKGFDGQYQPSSLALQLKNFYQENYTAPLEELLTKCTDNDPLKRPTITEFINSLNEWKGLKISFHKTNRRQWNEIQNKLFPISTPSRVIWTDLDEIIKVLKVVSLYHDLNHMFFPESGGLDLEDARTSHEPGCLELDCELIYVIKPYRLIFESFPSHPEWNYFRLETTKLAPSGVYTIDDIKGDIDLYEEVTEVKPGVYDDADLLYHDMSYDDEDAGKDQWRSVTRYFRGTFVFFAKRSPYNLAPETYDGRHNEMDMESFRSFIEKWIDAVDKDESFDNDEYGVYIDEF